MSRAPECWARLANLFTLVENCRQANVEPEAYLIDLVTALARGASPVLADWLPRAWKRRRTDRPHGVASQQSA